MPGNSGVRIHKYLLESFIQILGRHLFTAAGPAGFTLLTGGLTLAARCARLTRTLGPAGLAALLLLLLQNAYLEIILRVLILRRIIA